MKINWKIFTCVKLHCGECGMYSLKFKSGHNMQHVVPVRHIASKESLRWLELWPSMNFGPGFMNQSSHVNGRMTTCRITTKTIQYDKVNQAIVTHNFYQLPVAFSWFTSILHNDWVDPGGPVVIILASGSEVHGFDPGRGRWIFSERKNPEWLPLEWK